MPGHCFEQEGQLVAGNLRYSWRTPEGLVPESIRIDSTLHDSNATLVRYDSSPLEPTERMRSDATR